MSAPSRPAIRYHGGKWQLAPWIISHFPPHRIYVEPYGGGGSVLLRKPRSFGEVYNDIDGEIVNLFRVLRDRGAELRRMLYFTPYSREEFEISYEPTDDELEQARRTLVRSFMGFGSVASVGAKSGFRANGHREFTTASDDWLHYVEKLPQTIERLRGVVIECKDGLEVMKQQDGPDTLHYVDPPYVHSTRHKRNAYCKKGYRYELSDSDHVDLAGELDRLEGMVIVSGYRCELYDAIYRGWRRVDRTHYTHRSERIESIWLSPKVPAMQMELEEVNHEVADDLSRGGPG